MNSLAKLTLLPLLAVLPLRAQPPVLGKIRDIELSPGDVREAIAGLGTTQEAALAKDPAALENYVRALLVQRLVLQQAAEEKTDQDPAVAARLVRARETALAEAYLDLKAAPAPGYPDAEETAAAYEAAKEKLRLPESYRLAQIFIPAGEDARLAALRKALKAPAADFAAIARSHSAEAASAAQGGEIGWLTAEQIQPELRPQITALKPGGVSAPIALADGWHVLKLLETRPSRIPALEEIRAPFIARLRAEKTQLNRRDHLARLVQEHPLAINQIELSKLAQPSP